ncbi:uncharacterized protein BHQ10_007205 [Talaromyces amestolkiae]|uniref:Zn(2)-C6 fungal-type domain-containing protein n=1 Tax=Talaromyces amestolkiae TaxID=1196081 RepID=A0A364L5Z7_TALAM|nr:uncharacterized protein BHQ10_007205 [Talaromyces amestolkiae]RAO71193.1 hypothetical protein BHQ10_007205 [Talaromyces amestolkiae]
MAAADHHTRSGLVPIAPAPVNENGANQKSAQAVMAFSCRTCAKRKVKCDKVTPICSSCRKAKLDCLYQAPLSRSRKRKPSDDELEKLARYERILYEHGLLDAEPSSPAVGETPEEPISLQWNEPGESGSGKLLANQGKSRYIDSRFWHNFGDNEIQGMLDGEHEDDDQMASGSMIDPLTGAFLGSQQDLLQYHPTHMKAMSMWETYTNRIEPLCKILHVPSTAEMLVRASKEPEKASKTDECLLFAIYHFAVFSITEDECIAQFGKSRATVMERYHFATRQALVNASFLKTTELPILQALVIFLIPCAFFYDPNTYWILTGVATRIAQRMGLHRDGETLALPPFEVQMRRRLFYRLLPLDANASQMSGVGLSILSLTWDTKEPLNVDDNQIWPGMTKAPQEKKGASEMIFCLARASVGKYFAKAGRPNNGSGSAHFKDYQEAELVISKAESEVEETFIRYCDVINPLHFLTVCSIRSGIIAMRLRIHLPRIRNQTATDEEKRNTFQFARRILDTDSAVCANASLTKYRWHTRPLFLWGTWDSLVVVLTILWRNCDILSALEVDAAWKILESVFYNHDELLELKRALYLAFGRLTLKAWDTHPPSISVPEPSFITTLRYLQKRIPRNRIKEKARSVDTEDIDANSTPIFDPSSANDANPSLNGYFENADFDFSLEFNLEEPDWAFWDHLLQIS